MSRGDKRALPGDSASRRNLLKTIGVAGTAGLAGCMGGPASTPTQGTATGGKEITLLTYQAAPEYKEVYNNIKKKFEKDTEHTITYEYTGVEEYPNRLSSMIRGGNTPELGSFSTSLMASLWEDDLLVPVDDVLEDIGGISDSLVLKLDGNSYTVPYNLKTQEYSVRGDLAEESGNPLSSDMSSRFEMDYGGFRDLVSGMDGLDGQTRGLALVGSQTTYGTFHAINWLWSNAVNIWDGPQGDVNVVLDEGKNRDRAIEVLNYLNDISQYSPDAANWSWSDVSESFSTGGVGAGMYSVGLNLAAVKRNNSQWLDSVQPLMPPLKRRKEEGARGVVFITSHAIHQGSDNPEAAKDWIRWFMDSDEYINYLHAQPYHTLPTTEEVMTSDQFKDDDLISERPEILDFHSQQLPELTSLVMTADGGGLNPGAGKAYGNGTLGAMIGRVTVQGKDPGESVNEAAEQLRQF